MLRIILIKMLFYTLSVEKKLDIGVYVNKKILELAEVIYSLTGKNKRRSHKRWPYKTKNTLPEVENTAEEVKLPVVKTNRMHEHSYPEERAYKWFYYDEIKNLSMWQNKFFSWSISKISSWITPAKRKLNREYTCSSVWPNTVEVTRTR